MECGVGTKNYSSIANCIFYLSKKSNQPERCLCILTVVYVFLLFVHVFLLLSMYTYCCPRILRRGYPD